MPRLIVFQMRANHSLVKIDHRFLVATNKCSLDQSQNSIGPIVGMLTASGWKPSDQMKPGFPDPSLESSPPGRGCSLCMKTSHFCFQDA